MFKLYRSPDSDGGTPPPASPPPADNGSGGDEAKTVPYARFAEINSEKKALEERLAKIEADAKARQEKELAEQNKWKELAEAREKELEAERLNRLRLQVATAKGLPVEFASRLQGGNEKELAEDAARLAEFIRPNVPGVPPAPGRKPPGPQFTAEQLSDPEFVRKNAAKIQAAAAQS